MTATKKKTIKIVLLSVLGVVVLFIAIMLGSLLVQKYIKKSPVPMFMGCGWFIVISPSMQGTINKGDLVVVKKTDDYELGDIVMYLREEDGKIPITHRLYLPGPEEGTFITKGDNNRDPDAKPITVDDIVGEVVLTIPYVGTIFDWILHESGYIYILALIIIIVAAVFFWNWFSTEKGEENSDSTEEENAGSTDSPEGSEDDSSDSVETLSPETNSDN